MTTTKIKRILRHPETYILAAGGVLSIWHVGIAVSATTLNADMKYKNRAFEKSERPDSITTL